MLLPVFDCYGRRQCEHLRMGLCVTLGLQVCGINAQEDHHRLGCMGGTCFIQEEATTLFSGSSASLSPTAVHECPVSLHPHGMLVNCVSYFSHSDRCAVKNLFCRDENIESLEVVLICSEDLPGMRDLAGTHRACRMHPQPLFCLARNLSGPYFAHCLSRVC